MLIILFIIACIEVASLIKLGQAIGGGPVLGVIILTAVLGLTLLRLGGRATFSKLAANAFAGRLSATDLLRRELSLLLAGILLIVPGLLTDAAGIAFLGRYFLSRFPSHRPKSKEGDVIDVEYQVHDKVPRE